MKLADCPISCASWSFLAWPILQSPPFRCQSFSERLYALCHGLLMLAARTPAMLQRTIRPTLSFH